MIVLALAQRHLQHQRDEVGLRPVVLADVALRVRAGGVEVTQAAAGHVVQAVHPGEHALDHVFALAVGAAGLHRLVLADGQALRLLVEVGGGGEDEARDPLFGGGLQQVAAGQHVVAQVAPGPLHALVDQGVGGEVQDAVVALAVEEPSQGVGLQQVAMDEARRRMHSLAVAVDEVVADRDLVAARDEQIGHVAADVACAAGHQQLHGRSPGG